MDAVSRFIAFSLMEIILRAYSCVNIGSSLFLPSKFKVSPPRFDRSNDYVSRSEKS